MSSSDDFEPEQDIEADLGSTPKRGTQAARAVIDAAQTAAKAAHSAQTAADDAAEAAADTAVAAQFVGAGHDAKNYNKAAGQPLIGRDEPVEDSSAGESLSQAPSEPWQSDTPIDSGTGDSAPMSGGNQGGYGPGRDGPK